MWKLAMFLGAATSPLAPVAAQEEFNEWELLMSDPDEEADIYFRPKDIYASEGHLDRRAKMWIRYDFVRAGPGTTVKEVIFLNTVNCVEMTYKPLQVTIYPSKGDLQVRKLNTPEEYLTPNTKVYHLAEGICTPRGKN